METRLNVFPAPADACAHVARMMARHAKKGAAIALSGGFTPKLMFEIMAKDFSGDDWSGVKFFWVDERMVPETDAESNFGEFARILVESGTIKRGQCFQMEYSGDERRDLQAAEDKIRANVPFHGGLPRFDLVVLGIGADGHTASIFPGDLQQFESPKVIDAVQHPQSGQWRLTLTGSVINNASEAAFLCTGTSKADIVKKIVADKKRSLPAAHVKPQRLLQWALDEAAAAKINH